MRTKAADIFERCKYELGVFALLCIQVLFNIEELKGMLRSFYVYYLVDFSMGKTSRLLIGSIVSLFTDKPTEAWINSFARIVLFLTLLLTAVVIGHFVKAAKNEMKMPVYAFILFFVSGSFTLYGFSKFFGMLDIYMYIFALLAIVFAQNKYLRWLTPLLCAAGVFVNYSFTISYFPIVILVILYLAESKEKKAADIILFCITVIVTVALTFYCAFIGNETMVVSFDELWQRANEKAGYKIGYDFVEYFKLYLYNDAVAAKITFEKPLPEYSPIDFVITMAKYMLVYENNLSGLVTLAIAVLPVIAMFWIIWIMSIRNTKNKSRRFVYACFMLSTFFIPISVILSTDPIRWIAAGVINQFLLCFYMFYKHDEPFEAVMNKMKSFFSNNKFVLVLMFAFYAFSIRYNLGTF